MNKLGFAIIVLSCFMMACNNAANKDDASVSTTEVSWVSISDLESKLADKPKKIIVDVYTPWCGPCKMMDRTTFSDPDVIKKLNTEFYPVKFNAEGPDPVSFKGKEYKNPGYDPARARRRNAQHQLSPFFSVRGYPSIVVLDEQLNIVEKITGYRGPEQLIEALSKHSS